VKDVGSNSAIRGACPVGFYWLPGFRDRPMTVELTSQLKGLQDLNTRDVQNRCFMMFPHQKHARKHARLKFAFLFQVPSLFHATFRFQPPGCQSKLFFKLLNFQNTKKNLAWQSLSLATLRSSGVAITAMPNICHPSSRWTVTLAMEIYILRPLAFDHENGVLPC
jgi:hypothetical protein